jgi:hypothetical protein
MSLFILMIALLAWRMPLASVIVAGALVEYWWRERGNV